MGRCGGGRLECGSRLLLLRHGDLQVLRWCVCVCVCVCVLGSGEVAF